MFYTPYSIPHPSPSTLQLLHILHLLSTPPHLHVDAPTPYPTWSLLGRAWLASKNDATTRSFCTRLLGELDCRGEETQAQNWCCLYRPRWGMSHTRIGYAWVMLTTLFACLTSDWLTSLSSDWLILVNSQNLILAKKLYCLCMRGGQWKPAPPCNGTCGFPHLGPSINPRGLWPTF
jgi:hypothetical protein